MFVGKYSREIIPISLVKEIACNKVSFPQSKKKKRLEISKDHYVINLFKD